MNDRDEILQVQQATDIVALIGEQVALKPKGREFSCLCPFHEDHNPSMFVSPQKQIFKCFVCGAGGDAFKFVMNYHKMTFPEALRHLADRAGIKLQPRGAAGSAEGSSERQIIAEANDLALGFFGAMYRHPEVGAIARQYVAKRGISDKMLEQFQIGYAPDGWDALATAIQRNRWNRKAFELAGLVSLRKQGEGYYDRLRHRLIFPICDALGRPIAFGGRKLRDEDEPKYLNSPETALFNKSATLYGLHLAKQAIIGSRTAVIVEGYTDVIACHQAGIRNVVATLGTALTIEHVRALRHFADRVVLIYDADDAGQNAADRAIEVFMAGSLDVLMAILPDGLDPADLLAQPGGVDRWNAAVDAARDALEFQFDRIRDEFEATSSLAGRERISEDYLRKLAGYGLDQMNPIRRSLVIQRLASLLHLDEQTISRILRRFAPRPRNPRNDPQSTPQDDARTSTPMIQPVPTTPEGENPADVSLAPADSRYKIKVCSSLERVLIGCLLRSSSLFHETVSDGRTLDEAITPTDLWTAEGRALYQLMYDRLAEGQDVTLARMLAEMASSGQPELADMATLADHEVEIAVDGHEERLKAIFVNAADAILREHREASYRQKREQVLIAGAGRDTSIGQEQLLLRMAELRRANESPVRIARIRGGSGG